MTRTAGDRLAAWFAALEKRHLGDLTFQEVRRGVQALSSLYVERRRRLPTALDGAGKRAAFALYYGPLHFLLAREVVRGLRADVPPPATIIDLGCGTGAAGAAWALLASGRPEVLGVDRSGWAVGEAAWTYRVLKVRGRARRSDLEPAARAGPGEALLAALTVNELGAEARARLLPALLTSARRGARVLVIDAVARSATPWWEEWSAAFVAAGGRDDLWTLHPDLPEGLRLLDRAAGLDHREMKARSLWLDGSGGAAGRDPGPDRHAGSARRPVSRRDPDPGRDPVSDRNAIKRTGG